MSKLKQHWPMLLCLAAGAAIAVLVVLRKSNTGLLPLLVLACPLSMVAMMVMMGGSHSTEHKDSDNDKSKEQK